MTMFRATTIALALAASMAAGTAAQACSSGFLADLACKAGIINKDTANGLDLVHKGFGNPLGR